MEDVKLPQVPAEEDATGGAIDTLRDSLSEKDAKKDLRLCAVCLQWTVDGHDCYRADVCPS